MTLALNSWKVLNFEKVEHLNIPRSEILELIGLDRHWDTLCTWLFIVQVDLEKL